jgi:hypothetical protein
MAFQPLGVVWPGVLQVAPEGAAQRRGRALGELGLEHLAPLRDEIGAALAHVDGQQLRQPDVRVERVALLAQAARAGA